MYLVVMKYDYYPSVYEFNTKEEAMKKYNDLKDYRLSDKYDLNERKLYITKVEESCGNLENDVDWY